MTTQDFLVSVIVASYNNERYIEDMIQSVLKQSYSNWELIITDDASPDNSNNIIEKHLTDSRIKLYKHKENKGAGAAFKTCMENSSGEIIAMLGADDALKHNALEVLLNEYRKNPDAAMIIGGLEKTDNNLILIGEQIIFNGFSEGINSILENGFAYGWDTFRHRKYILTEGFVEEQKRAVDQDLYFKMEEIGKLYFFNDCLYLYRENSFGISQNQNQYVAIKYHINAINNALKRRGLSKRYVRGFNKYLEDLYLGKALFAKNKGFYTRVVFFVFLSFFRNPFSKIDLKLKLLLYPFKFWKK